MTSSEPLKLKLAVVAVVGEAGDELMSVWGAVVSAGGGGGAGAGAGSGAGAGGRRPAAAVTTTSLGRVDLLASRELKLVVVDEVVVSAMLAGPPAVTMLVALNEEVFPLAIDPTCAAIAVE